MSVWQYAQGLVVLSPASSGQMGWSKGNLQKETAKLWEFSWSHIPKSPALDRIGRTEKRKRPVEAPPQPAVTASIGWQAVSSYRWFQ
jgi:hypothetical protein